VELHLPVQLLLASGPPDDQQDPAHPCYGRGGRLESPPHNAREPGNSPQPWNPGLAGGSYRKVRPRSGPALTPPAVAVRRLWGERVWLLTRHCDRGSVTASASSSRSLR
jgi:hypothetical protein